MATTQVTYNALGSGVIAARDAKVLGTIIAPNAKVELRNRSLFKGAICAENIKVSNLATFLPHGSTTPLPIAQSVLAGGGENLEAALLPTVYELSQNFPNTFNPSTVIKYGLPHTSSVMLEVYNTLGQRVALLVNEHQEAGNHEVVFQNPGLASGVYFYRLHAVSSKESFVQTKKLLLLK